MLTLLQKRGMVLNLFVYGLHEWQRARNKRKITRTLRKYIFLYSTFVEQSYNTVCLTFVKYIYTVML